MRRIVLPFLVLVMFLCGCQKDTTDTIQFNTVKLNDIKFNNILILGNSITISAPIPDLGWYGNWGMAASAQDKDYVHVLQKKYREISPSATITPVNFAEWEATHATYDLSKLDQYLNTAPDLVILRLGENVTSFNNFEASITKLINYIKSKSPSTKFIITGVFWNNGSKEGPLQAAASANNIPFIPISYLNTPRNVSYTGARVMDTNGNFYEIKDKGIAKHPADIGMWKLAAILYNEMIGNKF